MLRISPRLGPLRFCLLRDRRTKRLSNYPEGILSPTRRPRSSRFPLVGLRDDVERLLGFHKGLEHRRRSKEQTSIGRLLGGFEGGSSLTPARNGADDGPALPSALEVSPWSDWFACRFHDSDFDASRRVEGSGAVGGGLIMIQDRGACGRFPSGIEVPGQSGGHQPAKSSSRPAGASTCSPRHEPGERLTKGDKGSSDHTLSVEFVLGWSWEVREEFAFRTHESGRFRVGAASGNSFSF